MPLHFIRFLTLPMLAVLSFGALAQVDVDQSLTIEQYVNDVLLGEGVTATNISFIGSPEQIGYLTGGLDAGLPVEGGVVLSSGNVTTPFTGDATGCATGTCGTCAGALFQSQRTHRRRFVGHRQQCATPH